jgi:predicted extracellular nuclease
MTRLFKTTLAVALVLGFAGVAAAQTAVFFSEYIEGSSNNKAVEIYNGTGADLDLSRMTLDRINNGGTVAPVNYTFTGTLLAGDVYVIGNPSTTGVDPVIVAQSDLLSTITFYNGDDILILYIDGVIVDSIGQNNGIDPGVFWGTAPCTTAEYTLVRKATVCFGDLDPTNAYDPATEWDSYPQNTVSYLGSHTNECTVPNENATWGTVKALFE